MAPKAYNIGGALALREDAGYSFATINGPVTLNIGQVLNESTTVTSGTIRVALFVTLDPTPGTYWTIASTDIGTLPPLGSFGPASRTVSYAAPPDGIYYIHMGVFEFEPGSCADPTGFCLDDFVTFTNRVQVFQSGIYDAGLPPAPTTTVVEYLHTGFNHYFVTSFADEIAALDAGQFAGWVRTGLTFKVWSSNVGNLPGVCRFFSTSFAPRSSHFYTPFADECTTVRANPDWQFEAIAYYVQLTDLSGGCTAGTLPLYRLYNDGQSGAPNHRYTTSLAARNQMVAQGWTPEGYGPLGAIACVPV
jgi:hypothetical protein